MGFESLGFVTDGFEVENFRFLVWGWELVGPLFGAV